MKNKRIFTLIIFFILYFGKVSAQEETVYDKIDLFGEVLDKISKELSLIHISEPTRQP